MSLAVDNTEQVKIDKLLDVVLSGNLNFDEHVSYTLSICSQRLYLIKLLHSHGMPESKLHVIFVALIVSIIFYALIAYSTDNQGKKYNMQFTLRHSVAMEEFNEIQSL